MLGVAFTSVRLGVVYGLAPVMKHAPALMTVPNLFCQRAAQGEVLQVLDDRPLAFIHVEDAVEALVLAQARLETSRTAWEVVNAAPEVATIGQVAHTVQRLGRQRGRWVRIQGGGAFDAEGENTFQVRSRLPLQPRRCLAQSLGDVFDFFLAQRV
jgi:nucleoside-diphosphate-sugar epimerase